MLNLCATLQLENPGKLSQVGFLAGARSTPMFDWVRNLTTVIHESHVIDDLDYEVSSVFALFWNMLKKKAPEVVIQDITKFLRDEQITQMNPCGLNTLPPSSSSTASLPDSSWGIYTMKLGSHDAITVKADLAPPAGVFATNYCR